MRGDLGVMLGQPDAQHAAHGEPDDHDAVAARRQLRVGVLGGGRPVLPRRVEHVLYLGAVTREQRHLDA